MTKRDRLYAKYGGRCAYTGQPLPPDWQVDHKEHKASRKFRDNTHNPDHPDNLVPTLRIINHYKRGMNVEDFRNRIATMQGRLSTIPVQSVRAQTNRRRLYLQQVADAFGITPETPFCGKFYFETL